MPDVDGRIEKSAGDLAARLGAVGGMVIGGSRVSKTDIFPVNTPK